MLTYVEFKSGAFPAYEGEAEKIGFLCFIEPHTDHVRKFLKKIPTRERIEMLQWRLDAALAAHAEIRDVKWSTHQEFNGGGA